MRRLFLTATFMLAVSSASAQFGPGGGFGGGGSGGGGGGGVSSLSTSCPAQAGQPLTGAVTLPFGVGPVARNPVSGATDTILTGDCGQSIEYTDAATVAVTVPQAGSAGFLSGFTVSVAVKSGAGPVTFTTTTSIFSSSGTVTLVLNAGQSATLQSDGTNWNVYSGGVPTIHPGYITGTSYWYPATMPGTALIAGATPVLNTIYCEPFYVGTVVTIKALGSDVTTLDSGGNYGWAIYNNSATHRPGTLVDYAAPALTTNTGVISGAMHNVTDTIGPGVYWICGSSDNAVNIVVGISGAQPSSSWGVGSSSELAITASSSLTNGVKCLVSTTVCGGTGSGWGVWSAGVFTWGNATSATWSDNATGVMPLVAFEVN